MITSTHVAEDDDTNSALPTITVNACSRTGTGLIWDAEQYRILRTKRRIVGALIGSLPGYRQQDATRGLPVQLSVEEVSLCKSKKWAIVFESNREDGGNCIDDMIEREYCDDDDRSEYGRDGSSGLESSRDDRERKDAEAKKRMKKAALRSQWGTKPQKKKQKSSNGTAYTTTNNHNNNSNNNNNNDMKNSNGGDGKVIDWETALGNTGHVTLPLVSEFDERFEKKIEREDSGTYEMTKIERYKSAVFRDLHEKGFTMTSAAKFGGDYLAYPGDPMLFHAYFTVRVLERGEKMTPLSCLSVTRMAHAARKNVVFAFCGDVGRDSKNSNGTSVRINYFTCVPDIELSSNRGF